MRPALAVIAALLIAAPAAQALAPTREHPIVIEDMKISREQIRHWERIALRSGSDREAARQQVVQLLISFRWITGEARWRGIVVSRAQVRRSFRSTKRSAFPRHADFRRFLRHSGQTRADILLRVRMDLLSNRLRRLVVAGATDPEEQQRRLDEFVAQFREYWSARTLCAPGYFIESDCSSSGEAPPA